MNRWAGTKLTARRSPMEKPITEPAVLSMTMFGVKPAVSQQALILSRRSPLLSHIISTPRSSVKGTTLRPKKGESSPTSIRISSSAMGSHSTPFSWRGKVVRAKSRALRRKASRIWSWLITE